MFKNTNDGGYSLADVAAVAGGNRNNNGNGIFGGDGIGLAIILFLLFGYGNGNEGGLLGGGRNNTTTAMGYQDAITRQAITNGFDINNIETALHNLQGSVSDNFCNTNMSMLNGFANNNLAVTTGVNAIQNSLKDNNIAMMQGNFDLQQAVNANNIANMQQGFGLQQAINGVTVAGMQNTNALSTQLNNMAYNQQDCCCQTQRLIESTSAQAAYNAATNAAQANYNLATESCAIKQNTTDNVRAAIDVTNDVGRAILQKLDAMESSAKDDRIASLLSEVASLKGQASQDRQNAFFANQLRDAVNEIRPRPVPSFNVPNPNYGYYTPCDCNSRCCNGNY